MLELERDCYSGFVTRFTYGHGIQAILNGTIDLDTSDLRVILVEATTTANTEFDVNSVGAFTTLAEWTDTAYPATIAARVPLASQTVSYATIPDRRVEANSTPTTIVAAAAGGAPAIKAYIIYAHFSDTDDSQNIPITYDSNPSALPATAGVDDIIKVTFTGNVWLYAQSFPLPV